MPAPASSVGVVNLALSLLYQAPITSLSDSNSTPAGGALIQYDQCRRSLLRNYDWNFARWRSAAPLIANLTPPFDFASYYQLPTNLLKLLWVGDDKRRYHPHMYDIQGTMLLLNYSGGPAYPTVSSSSPYTITGVSQATSGIVTLSAAPPQPGTYLLIAGVTGMTQLNGNVYTVGNIYNNSFVLLDPFGNPVNTTGYGAYSSGGTATLTGTSATPSNSYGVPTDSVWVKYTQEVTDVTQMDALFIDALSQMLASRLAMPITGDQELLKTILEMFKMTLAEAVAINHIERPVLVTEIDPIALARIETSEIWELPINPASWGDVSAQ